MGSQRPTVAPPPPIIEIGYYLVLVYGVWSAYLGIAVPMLGSLMLLVLAVACVVSIGPNPRVLGSIHLLIACAVAFVAVHVMAHEGVLTDETSRSFITWVFSLIIVGSLNMRRHFPHRCVLVLLGIGLSVLPYLTFDHPGRAEVQAKVASGDFNHTNGLGSWFAFTCLWFTILAIETRRITVRGVAIAAAVVSLYVVGLSVSRGAMVGVAIGATLAFRRVLGRGFFAVLTTVIVIGTIVISGTFDEVIAEYSVRGVEETGRLLVWPPAMERVFDSPFVGVGAKAVNTYVPARQNLLAPHNSFLWFALASGVVPLVLFVVWWIKVSKKSFFFKEPTFYGPYRLPLLMLTFVATSLGDLEFMQPWGVVTFCLAMAPETSHGVRRFVVRQVQNRPPDDTGEPHRKQSQPPLPDITISR